MNCCVLGLGYIGLPTAALIASNRIKVNGFDVNSEIVKTVNNGEIHIEEKDLQELITEVVNKGYLEAKNSPCFSDVFLICVPTPFTNLSNKTPQPDISYVIEAVRLISNFLKKDNLVIIESTCPVGTTEKVSSLINKLTGLSKYDIDIAYCPERVLPGNILKELVNNDRVVGGLTDRASEKAKEFYLKFCKSNIFSTNAKTAELMKLTENAYRDVNIAFANELSIISHQIDVDVYKLIELANFHPRVNILAPGCGVGGHCIAVDPWFIVSEFPRDSELIRTAREVNNKKIRWVIKNIEEEIKIFEKNIKKNPNIGIMGLTFKENTDDIRNSPALDIYRKLSKKDFSLIACDPNIRNRKDIKLKNLEYTIKECDILVFLVAHKEFRSLDFKEIIFLDYCGVSKKN